MPPLWRRCAYRLLRNPAVLFAIAPTVLFVVLERFPSPQAGRRERLSVWLTNLALLLMAAGLSALIGFKSWCLIELTLMLLAGGAGVWLFYVQHQFADAYWTSHEDWDYTEAALQGSSFYKLPAVLRWFSGNIGFHHIHHLSPQIPNYHLQRCHNAEPLFGSAPTLTLGASLRSAHASALGRAAPTPDRISTAEVVSQRLVRQAHRSSKAYQARRRSPLPCE